LAVFAALAYVAGYLIIEDVVQFVRYALCRLIPNPLFRAFCGDDEKHVGAIELWHNDPEKSHEMGLVDG
jgi:hypothetical protein